MRSAWGFALLLATGCALGSPSAKPATAPRPDLAVDDLRDNAIGPAAAEPPWLDLLRHTSISGSGKATHPGPSRDGARFVYATTEFGSRPQIALRETDGVAPVRLTAEADNLFPRISPDGQRFAWASNRGGKGFDIYVARLDAPFAVSRLTHDEGDDIAPSWSPDGRKIVYAHGRADGVWQLVIVDVGTRLKTYLGPGLYPDWSPDAANPLIAFQSQPKEAGGRSGVWVVGTDGRRPREVVGDKTGVWSAVQPRFSPDGRWIAYATVNKSTESRVFGAPDQADDVWIIRPDGTYDTRLTDDLSAESWPAWGGSRVFFTSTRELGAPNVWSVQVKPLEEAQ